MSTQNPLQAIANILSTANSRLPINLEHILYKRNKTLGWVLLDVANLHKAKGVHEFFASRNSDGLKQHFHVASKLTLAAIGMNGGPSFEVGSEIFYALLSDNPEVISAMASVETPELLNDRHNPLRSRFTVHMWQLVIQGDYEALQVKVEKLGKNGRRGDRELAAKQRDFFSLLMRGDKQGLEDLIHQHALIKSVDPLTEDFMSYLGTMETKLCWLKGIPVQIDSPLLPMALMPMAPLEHYDDEYDFLKPGWVPPPQGLFGKVSRWISR